MVCDVSLIQLLRYQERYYSTVHPAQGTLICTPSSKQTCHENYNAKINYTPLSQIIFSCVVKLKYDSYSYIYTFSEFTFFLFPILYSSNTIMEPEIAEYCYMSQHVLHTVLSYLLPNKLLIKELLLICIYRFSAMQWKLKSVWTTICICLSESKHSKVQPIIG
jgi:hypothetical protein